LFEAVGLSVIGGAVGVISGMAAAYAIAHAAGWPLLIEPQSVVLAVVFSGMVGVFFGWYPALRASKLDPIEALRHT
jgi:putative ABC transport system permease protein